MGNSASRAPVLVHLTTNARYVLNGPSLTVGRDPANHLVLSEDEYCSANHARIYWDQGKLLIEDLNSSNGTALNDEMVQGTHPLSPGDIIKFGRTTFRIE